nr:hypothetical protein [uncultured Lichenicoccus sp.]
MEGRFDAVDDDRIVGCARDIENPGQKIRLRVRDNGAILGEVVADSLRPDLLQARGGDGCVAFSLPIPGWRTRRAATLRWRASAPAGTASTC